MKCTFNILGPLFLFLHVVAGIVFDIAPKHYYSHGDKVDLLVNKVESDATQLPYSYKDLPFVCPQERPLSLSLGEILRGDRLWVSKYDLKFGHDAPCQRLCNVDAKERILSRTDWLIRNGYVVHWSVEGLPGATTFLSPHKNNKYYAAGFPLGFVKDDISYLYNHVTLVLRYRREDNGLHTIVGFEVYPKSVSDETCPGSSKNYENFPIMIKRNAKGELLPLRQEIPFSYSVYWRQDNSIDYDSRWDMYYDSGSATHHQIRWFSLLNCLTLVFLFSLIVAILLLRVLKSDIKSKNDVLPSHELDNNMNSWKSLSNEVLKRPKQPFVLSLLVASGFQLCMASIGVMFTIAMGKNIIVSRFVLSSIVLHNQGAFFSLSLLFFIISAILPSFTGLILHKVFNNIYLNAEYDTKKTASLSIIYSGFLPALILSTMLFLNFFVWAKEASTALPFGTIILFITILFLIIIPLGMLGGYYGNRYKFSEKSFLLSRSGERTEYKSEVRKSFKYNSWIFNPFYSTVVFGLVPFGIAYVELLFIFNSVWLEKTSFYYMYGFLLATLAMLIVIIAESTIIATYISLSYYQNPHWQWLSFRVGASVGLYIFLYAIYYFIVYLDIHDFISGLLYFSHMALACGLISLSFGSVSVFTGILFIRKIYDATKAD